MYVTHSSSQARQAAPMGGTMANEPILMLHPAVGVLAILTAVWVAAETLNISSSNAARIRGASIAVACLMWAAYLVGGYWYVLYFATDKALILAGPWPFAHSFVMETKRNTCSCRYCYLQATCPSRLRMI